MTLYRERWLEIAWQGLVKSRDRSGGSGNNLYDLGSEGLEGDPNDL